jgi:taurine dioxygenase
LASTHSNAEGADVLLGWLDDSADDSMNAWHTDFAWRPEPPDYAVLHCVEPPPPGADTLWASLYAVYDALSAKMQTLVEDLLLDLRAPTDTTRERASGANPVVRSIDGERCPQPLVRVHPLTGDSVLFLCGDAMQGIVGMKREEGSAIIELLSRGLHDPGVQCRWTWQQHDLVIWDERCTNHLALSDQLMVPRVMRHCTVGASQPISRRDARIAREAGRPLTEVMA